MTPQQKKAHSLARDCRNRYGESTTAARKSIPRRRARKHRQYRHAVKQAIFAAATAADLERAVAAVRRDGWQKVADVPLSTHLRRQHERRVRTGQRPT